MQGNCNTIIAYNAWKYVYAAKSPCKAMWIVVAAVFNINNLLR